MKKTTVLQGKLKRRQNNAYVEVKTGKNAFFLNRVSNVIGNRYRSHEDRMNEVGVAINDFYEMGGDFSGKDIASLYGMIHAEQKYVSERSDKIVNSDKVLTSIGELKYGLRTELNSLKTESGVSKIGGLEKSVDDGMLRVGAGLDKKKYHKMAGGVIPEIIKSVAYTALGFAAGLFIKGETNYNVDKAALEAFVRPSAVVVNTVSAQEISKQKDCAKYVKVDAVVKVAPVIGKNDLGKIATNFVGGFELDTKASSPEKRGGPLIEQGENIEVVQDVKNYAPVDNVEATVAEKVEVKQVKRPGYYDYKFGDCSIKLDKLANEKWANGDKLGGLVTRLGSGIAWVNDGVEYPIARPVVGIVGGIARSVEKTRFLERVFDFIGIKRPLREALAKDDPNENVFAVGSQGGEDVAAFVMDGTVGGEGFDGFHADVLSLKPKEGLDALYAREATKMNGHLKMAEIAAHYLWFFNHGGGHGGGSSSGSGLTRTGGGENAGGLTRH